MHAAKKAVDRILAVATAVLFATLVIVVTWQVVSRLVLNSPSTWSEELAKYCFVWLSLIAAALVFGERGHIAVTFVVDKFPRGARKVIAVLIQVLIAAFAVFVLIWGGIGAAQNTWLQNLTALPLQIGHMYIVMPIAGAFILFYALYNIWEDLRGEGPLTVEDPTAVDDDETAAALQKARELEGEMQRDPDAGEVIESTAPGGTPARGTAAGGATAGGSTTVNRENGEAR